MKPETKTSQHTQGPWTLHDLDENNPGREWSIVTTGPIAYVTTEPSDTGIANARLIASAPELLEAIKIARNELYRVREATYQATPSAESIAACNYAISKAEGTK